MVTFINKDASSGNVSRMTYAERRRINEQSREHRISARRARARAQLPQTPAPTSNSPRQDEDQPAHTGTSVVSLRTTTAPMESVLSFLSPNQTPVQGESTDARPRPGPGNSVDPFQVVSIPMNTFVLGILRYFKEVYHDSLWAHINTILRGKVDPRYLIHCTPETVILECMEDRTRMYCLLADVGCHMMGAPVLMDTATDQIATMSASDHNHLTLITRGTEALRRELASRAPGDLDTHILVEAFHLYHAATTIRLHDASRAHLAGVRAIIRDIVRRGIPINVVNAAMLSLVDMEISLQLFREIDLRSLTSPKAPIYVPVTSLDTGVVV